MQMLLYSRYQTKTLPIHVHGNRLLHTKNEHVMRLLWLLVKILDHHSLQESVMELHDKGQGNGFKLQPPGALF